MTEDLAHSSAVTRHPSAGLYDRVYAAVLPSVAVIAAHKNVPLMDDDQEVVLRDALRGVRRNTMRRIMNGDPDAISSLRWAIDHSLDVLASMRMFLVVDAVCGKGIGDMHALLRRAEDVLRPRSANDKSPTMNIWPDPVQAVSDYCRSLALAPQLTLPSNAAVHSGIHVMVDARPPGSGDAT